MFKGKQNTVSHFFTSFHAFFTFCSCLFHSCLSQRNKTRENCDGFLQRGVASLFLDLRLSDKTWDFCQSPFFPWLSRNSELWNHLVQLALRNFSGSVLDHSWRAQCHIWKWQPGDTIVALFSGKPLVGYTFCYSWAFFKGLRTFWWFQWIWALFGVLTHFTPMDLLNSWRNPRRRN